MRSSFTLALIASLVADIHAAPAPAPMPITDEQAQELAEICAMKVGERADKANNWKDSGADAFLTGYIKTQGSKNWLQRMDGHTTGTGKQEGIRRASSNFHSALDNMHEALQDSTIQSSLQIGQMVRDFAYESLNFQSGPDVGQILTIPSSVLGIIGGLASPVGGVAGIFGTFGVAGARAAKDSTKVAALAGSANLGAGVTNIVGATRPEDNEPDTESVTVGLATRLAQVFGFLTETIEDMRLMVFDGEENPNGRNLTFHDIGLIAPIEGNENTQGTGFDPDADPTDLPPHPVAQFFGEGKEVLVRVKKSLISGLLKDIKAYIIRDSSTEGRGRWCNKAGALEIDGECWFIRRADPKDPYLAQELGDIAMNSFGKHDINIEHGYRNAIACQEKLGDGQFDEWNSYLNNIGTDVLQAPPTDENEYPECFWCSLPVFIVTDAGRMHWLLWL
ncbi:hypothetical protein QBC40DRAFT_249818 [Triangularia verruculosa]|uniref:Uncharacterized protein n=1 Tax=Triangularia verruculosa TaxID=2587418 RepID=A0AAN6XQI1_9PEZI|nr:hypothetical protein QBC40DRAFT_249818 [Triangularia verruculosa]